MEIVRTGAADAARSLVLPEELRIGTVDGPPETQLHLVRTPAVAADGVIFVPLLGTGEIRMFDRGGRHVGTVGRQGEGPGEFLGLSRVYLVDGGETVVALDVRVGRVTALSRAGEVLGSVRLPRVEAGGAGFLTPAGRTGDRWILSAQVPYDWPEHGRRVDLRNRLFVAPAGLDVREALQWGERVVGEGSSEGDGVITYAFGRMFGMRAGEAMMGQRSLWQVTQSWAADDRGRLYLTAGDGEYRIDVYGTSGRVLRKVHVPHTPVPITDEHVRRYLAEARAHHDTTDAATEFGTDPMETDRFRAELPRPDHLPPLGRLLASGEGSLLVERPDLVEDPVALAWTRLGPQETHWDLFDPDGRLRGRLSLPPGTSPQVLGEDWLVAVVRDDLGVEHVVRYGFGESS